MSTAPSIRPTEITALLFCPTSKGKPADGKEYALALTKDSAGAGYTVTARYGKAGLNPLPGTDEVIKGVAYGEALKAFFTKLQEKTTQKPDTYTVKKESIPPDIADEGFRLAGVKAVSRKSPASPDWLVERLNSLIHPDKVDKLPVLLDGPQGTGKTYAAREFGLAAGFSTIQEVAGHSGLESLDMLGSFLPIGDGSFVWTDGPVTAAYRSAAEGRKALLLIDEVYRIPLKQRNFLLNALVPHRMPDGKQYYMLRAGRVKPGTVVDGIGKTEMIAAPVENLSVIGTSNSGSAFTDVEVDDPAAKERWHIVHVKMDEAAQKRILEQACADRKLPIKFAEAVLQLSKNTRKLTDDQFLEHALSPRLSFRVLSFVSTPDKKGFEAAAKEMIATVVGRAPNGELIKEHTEAYEKAIAESITKVGL